MILNITPRSYCELCVWINYYGERGLRSHLVVILGSSFGLKMFLSKILIFGEKK